MKIFAVAMILMPVAATAQAYLTVTCDEPRGTRLEVDETEIGKKDFGYKTESDGMTGVRPTFILNSRVSEVLTVVLGDSQVLHRVRTDAPTATEARIIFAKPKQITAFETAADGVWLYSLFPELSSGIISRVTHWTLNAAATAVQFHMRCRFSYGKPKR